MRKTAGQKRYWVTVTHVDGTEYIGEKKGYATEAEAFNVLEEWLGRPIEEETYSSFGHDVTDDGAAVKVTTQPPLDDVTQEVWELVNALISADAQEIYDEMNDEGYTLTLTVEEIDEALDKLIELGIIKSKFTFKQVQKDNRSEKETRVKKYRNELDQLLSRIQNETDLGTIWGADGYINQDSLAGQLRYLVEKLQWSDGETITQEDVAEMQDRVRGSIQHLEGTWSDYDKMMRDLLPFKERKRLWDEEENNRRFSSYHRKFARLPERIDTLGDRDDTRGYNATSEEYNVKEPNFNPRFIKRWMDGHLDLHGDEYYDSGGEPDYTKLAEEAAYNNGSEGYTWLDDPDHPIWDLAIEAFDDYQNLDTEVLDDEAFRTSEVKRIFPMSKKFKKSDYSHITQEMFDSKLVELIDPFNVLTIQGVYEILSEELNNEVLDTEGDLEEIVSGMSSADLISIPGMYEVLSEEFNNDILRELEDNRRMSSKQKTAIADADATLLQTTMSSLSKAKTPDEAMSLLQDISDAALGIKEELSASGKKSASIMRTNSTRRKKADRDFSQRGEEYYVHRLALNDTTTQVYANSEEEAIEKVWNGEGSIVDENHTTGLPKESTYLVERGQFNPVHWLLMKNAVEVTLHPERLLNSSRRTSSLFRKKASGDLDEFTRAYMEAALWSSTAHGDDENGTDDVPMDELYEISDIDPKCYRIMVTDCEKFQEENYADLYEIDDIDPQYSNDAMGGHDFWLTRAGHGAGFWDGDWPEPQATRLTEACERMGEANLDASVDGSTVYCD